MLASRSSRSRWRPLSASGGRGFGGARLAAIGNFQEAGERPRRNIAVSVPELRIAKREDPRIGDDGFQRERAPGAELRVLAAIVVDGHIALPHAHPRYRRAFRHAPHGGVAHVAGEHVGVQRVQRDVRVFQGPQRVAGIQAGADEILAGFFDQMFQFVRLHVARVVLDGDLEVVVLRLRAHIAQHLDRALDVHFDGTGATVLGAAQYGAHDVRAGQRRGVQHAADLLLRGARLGVEHFRSGADRPHADLDFDAALFGVAPDGPQILGFQVADETDLGEVDHLGAEFGAVVQKLERGPVLRAQAEQVDAEFDGGRGGGHGERGGCRHPQKAASGQVHFARSIQQPGGVCIARYNMRT